LKKLKIVLQSNLFYCILITVLTFYVFISTYIIKYSSKIDNLNIIEGTIIDIDVSDEKVSFILKDQEKVKCNYYKKNFDKINYKSYLGKKVRVYGNVGNLSKNTIPNTFNYKNYLYKNKIYISYKVNEIEIVEKENILYKIKNKIINRINIFDDITKTYINLFILGNKEYLNDDLYNNYKDNGIWHLFAISGMHINLLVVVLSKLFSKLKFKNTLITSILIYFMFLTGFSASVERVTVFFILSNIFKYYNFHINNIKILILTAFLILLINPFMIYNIGFLYSFLITFTIMLQSKYITGNYFVKILKISFVSFIVSLPITINVNYEINLLCIFLNVLYVPFIAFIMFPLSIITFIIPYLSSIYLFFINVLEISNNLFNSYKIALIIPKLPFVMIILYYLLLYLYYKFKDKKFLFLSLSIIIFNIFIYKLDNNYFINYFDVGQGDSSVIITPHKKDIFMIDTGGLVNSSYNVSNNIILYLKSIGINKISSMILSHGGMWLVSRIT